MRIRSIEIGRFGILADFRVAALDQGLNVVLGANEAGKTTLMEALRAALFGFPDGLPGRNTYRPSGSRRRLVVELEEKGNLACILERLDTDQGEACRLRDSARRTLPSTELSRLMAGVDRALYESVYSFTPDEFQHLDHLTAEAAGNVIAGAALGAVTVSPDQAIARLRTRAREAFAPNARSGFGQRALLALGETVARLEEIDRRQSEAEEARSQLAAVEASLRGLADEEKSLESEMERLRRRLDLRQSALALTAARAKLADLPPAAALPCDPLEALERARTAAATGARAAKTNAEWLRQLAAELAAFPLPDPILTHRQTLERLGRRAALYEDRRGELAALAAAEMEAEEDLAVAARELSAAEPPARPAGGEEANQIAQQIEEECRRLTLLADQQPGSAKLVGISLGVLAALTLFAASGFGFGPTVGWATSYSAALLALAYLVWAGREISYRTRAMRQLRQQVAELEQALTGEFAALPASPLVEQLKQARWSPSGVEPAEGERGNASSQRVAAATERRDELSAARERLAQDLENEQREAMELALACGLPAPAPDQIVSLVGELNARLAAGLRHEQERDEVERGIEQASAEHLVTQEQAVSAQMQLDVLLRAAGAHDEATYQALVEQSEERGGLAAEVERLRTGLRAQVGSADIGAIELEIQAADWAALADCLQKLEERRGELRREQEERLTTRGELINAVRVTTRERERETALQAGEAARAELAEALNVWGMATVAAELLSAVKQRAERELQGPVLTRASEIVEELTGGRYTRVLAPLGQARLEIEAADGSRLAELAHLSRGTREEIYLAVRLAYLEIAQKDGQRLPVLIDDAFVNFDPERAQRAARAVAELARRTQVIAFTCHPTIADYLTEAGAGLRIELKGHQPIDKRT